MKVKTEADEAITDKTVTVNFIKQLTPEWNKVSTYFVIIIIAYVAFRLISGFQSQACIQKDTLQDSIQAQNYLQTNRKIEVILSYIQAEEKRKVIDSVNKAKVVNALVVIGSKMGISEKELGLYEPKK